MKYYVLRADYEGYQNLGYEGELPRNSRGMADLDNWGGYKGRFIHYTDVPAVEIFKKTKKAMKPDIYFLDGLQIIINGRARKIIEEAIPENICQFIPLLFEAKCDDDKLYILNPLIVGHCICEEKTEYRIRAGWPFIEKHVFYKDKIPNAALFLIYESPERVIINQEIYELLHANNIKGFLTREIEVV